MFFVGLQVSRRRFSFTVFVEAFSHRECIFKWILPSFAMSPHACFIIQKQKLKKKQKSLISAPFFFYLHCNLNLNKSGALFYSNLARGLLLMSILKMLRTLDMRVAKLASAHCISPYILLKIIEFVVKIE